MPQAPTPTKERIVEAGAELFRRQGYTGTGVKAIVAAAGAPFGSLYHHFPGGKEQLGAEIIRWSGGMYGQLVGELLAGRPDLAVAVREAFADAGETLVDTDYADACPIATIALEVASTSEPLREATADVFASWLEGLTAVFAHAGIAEPRAGELAIELLCALEGAFILCRALRTTRPLHVAGEAVALSVEAALAA